MPSFLERLRGKSPEQKKKITVWTTAAIMMVIVAAWIIFFFPRGKANAPAEPFFGNLKQSFNEALKAVKK